MNVHNPHRATMLVNGVEVGLPADCNRRLSSFLRDDLHLIGTKIGCEQGDCGTCTILVDGAPVCSCLVPVGQLAGASVTTIEGAATHTGSGRQLQESFLRHQAVQCGFCTPAFILTAASVIDHADRPAGLQDAFNGILCRCTGYKKILHAIDDVADGIRTAEAPELPAPGKAVGTAVTRLDGWERVQGKLEFGADGGHGALLVRAVRSPFHHASFTLGDIAAYKASCDGIAAIFTADDVPGQNLHGSPPYADQPVLAKDEVRFRGEAIALIVGEHSAVEQLNLEEFPVTWSELQPQLGMSQSLSAAAVLLHPGRDRNILINGHVERGDVDLAFSTARFIVEGSFETQFVEHAYLEPEAGWAYREGDTVVVHSCTQAPHAHRAEVALVLGIPQENVWIVPTGVGGGFGGKLDLTVQPHLALAAWYLQRPVRMIYSREESISTSTKRHPAQIKSRIAADENGRIVAVDFHGDYNTGAYASFGTAVANRVPVHASGPYFVPNYRATTRAIHTHVTPAGAFRGFGMPQTLVAQEQLIDELARETGIDQLEFRLQNAISAGQPLVTGQVLPDSVGISACLKALRPRWTAARVAAELHNNNKAQARSRKGVGLSAMFYGCGNTAAANPSTIRIGITPDGKIVLHQGAVDAGQGANTVIPQIAADALGVSLDKLTILGADTNLTPDCGRTSASRQTFVTGNAAVLAGRALRRQILALSNGGPDSTIEIVDGRVRVLHGHELRSIELAVLPTNKLGYVLMAEETFNPDATLLGKNGQGSPYNVYAFGAQIAEIEVDLDLGNVKVTRLTAAHDVGRMVNPTLLQGQIEGGVAQGVGQALFEEFIPGVTETFHSYLMPTARDVPEIETIFVEDAASAGPFGAKGIGEPALVPTASAILNALYDAIGVRIRSLPATPELILAAIKTSVVGGCIQLSQ